MLSDFDAGPTTDDNGGMSENTLIINANPQSISPKSGSGYLPGGDGPPNSARPIFSNLRN